MISPTLYFPYPLHFYNTMCPGADHEPNGHANGANGPGAIGVNERVNGGMDRLLSLEVWYFS